MIRDVFHATSGRSGEAIKGGEGGVQRTERDREGLRRKGFLGQTGLLVVKCETPESKHCLFSSNAELGDSRREGPKFCRQGLRTRA